VGVLFLLNNMGIIRFYQLLQYWPVALIALGAYMLYERISTSDHSHNSPSAGMREAQHERH